MTRTLAVWALVIGLAGCLAAQESPRYVAPRVMERNLIYDPPAVYPPLAKKARISGAVELAVWIAVDGTVKEARLVKGHPLLVQAAIDAVKQRRYHPGAWWWERPTEVWTIVTVNFTMRSDGPPDKSGGEQPIVHVSQRYRLAQ